MIRNYKCKHTSKYIPSVNVIRIFNDNNIWNKYLPLFCSHHFGIGGRYVYINGGRSYKNVEGEVARVH